MKKIKILLFLAGIIFLASTCENENCHKSIPFVNSSDKDLYVLLKTLPPNDTSFLEFGNPTRNDEHRVLPHSEKKLSLRRDCYEGKPELQIYILDVHIFDTNSWKTVVEDYLILQRYDLTPDDVKALNWSIPYPPTPAMKNMKMYPPYKEE